MNKEEFEAQFDYVLEQPLYTEDGFLNEACMKELESAICNMPRLYDRRKDDPELSNPIFVHYMQIVAYFVHWAVRLLPGICPPDLEKATSYLAVCLKREFRKRPVDYFDEGWAEISICDINELLYKYLWDLSLFQQWNTEECLGKDWLDLDALLINVCISIRNEKRESDRFNRKFDDDWNEQYKGIEGEGI